MSSADLIPPRLLSLPVSGRETERSEVGWGCWECAPRAHHCFAKAGGTPAVLKPHLAPAAPPFPKTGRDKQKPSQPRLRDISVRDAPRGTSRPHPGRIVLSAGRIS